MKSLTLVSTSARPSGAATTIRSQLKRPRKRKTPSCFSVRDLIMRRYFVRQVQTNECLAWTTHHSAGPAPLPSLKVRPPYPNHQLLPSYVTRQYFTAHIITLSPHGLNEEKTHRRLWQMSHLGEIFGLQYQAVPQPTPKVQPPGSPKEYQVAIEVAVPKKSGRVRQRGSPLAPDSSQNEGIASGRQRDQLHRLGEEVIHACCFDLIGHRTGAVS